MSLGMIFMVMMAVVCIGCLIFIIQWMKAPNDRYDEMLERLAKGGKIE